MEVMFWKRSSMLPVLFPAFPVPWKDSSGKNWLLSDLLQKISVGEQVQVGGQSNKELGQLWKKTLSRTETFQQHRIPRRRRAPNKSMLSRFSPRFQLWSRTRMKMTKNENDSVRQSLKPRERCARLIPLGGVQTVKAVNISLRVFTRVWVCACLWGYQRF